MGRARGCVVMGSTVGHVQAVCVLPATGQGLLLGSMASRRQLPMMG